MPRTPDSRDGPLYEEEIILEEDTVAPSGEGRIKYVSGAFSFVDSSGSYDPRSGSGLSEAQHKALYQLIHFIDDGPADGFVSGAYKEILPSGSIFPTSVTWWESSSKLKKIVERSITWSGVTITEDEWKMYDSNGSLLVTATDTINYTNNIFETNRTRVVVVA